MGNKTLATGFFRVAVVFGIMAGLSFLTIGNGTAQAKAEEGWDPATATAGIAYSRHLIMRLVVREARTSAVPVSLALAVARAESNFDVFAESVVGARGVMQIMPSTALGDFGTDADVLWDPRQNVRIGLGYLERLMKRYPDRPDLVLSAYNAGPGRVGDPATARVVPVTRDYVDRVLAFEREYAAQAALWAELHNDQPLLLPDPALVSTPAPTNTVRAVASHAGAGDRVSPAAAVEAPARPGSMASIHIAGLEARTKPRSTRRPFSRKARVIWSSEMRRRRLAARSARSHAKLGNLVWFDEEAALRRRLAAARNRLDDSSAW